MHSFFFSFFSLFFFLFFNGLVSYLYLAQAICMPQAFAGTTAPRA